MARPRGFEPLTPRSGDRGVWEPRKFVYDRDHLLELIDALCGTVDARTLADIQSWPAPLLPSAIIDPGRLQFVLVP